MESAAIEIMRELSGRASFEHNDPVAVVLSGLLSWVILPGSSRKSNNTQAMADTTSRAKPTGTGYFLATTVKLTLRSCPMLWEK